MKLNYFPDTDSLYIELQSGPGVDSQEIADGMVLDFDASGNVIGLDIYSGASQKVDLNALELVGLNMPVTVTEQHEVLGRG